MIIKIPEERKAILIGKNGNVKKNLEKLTKTRIRITEDVEITGDAEGVLTASEVVKAIGRGFSPKKAIILTKENHALNVISLQGESEKTIKRLFGRVIGKSGSARKRIEETTGAFISVYGKTVGIIGEYEEVKKATRLVEELLKGRSHRFAYGVVNREK